MKIPTEGPFRYADTHIATIVSKAVAKAYNSEISLFYARCSYFNEGECQRSTVIHL